MASGGLYWLINNIRTGVILPITWFIDNVLCVIIKKGAYVAHELCLVSMSHKIFFFLIDHLLVFKNLLILSFKNNFITITAGP